MSEIKLDKNKVREMLNLNPDAREYFFANADKRWLEWLWGNGFLDSIKEKSEDPTSFSYSIPELSYLERMAKELPKEVAEIICSVEISEKTFNPEVISRFLRICEELPAEELVKIIPKIKRENWVYLMGGYNQYGFEYEKIFKLLADNKNYKNILILAEVVLTVRTREKIEEATNKATIDNPFYFSDLSYTKVFEYLVLAGDSYTEQALELAGKVMTEIVLLGEKNDNKEVFPIEELFYLFDVDFFSLELGKKEHLSYRDDVRELAAVIKVLAGKLISEKCEGKQYKEVSRIFYKYIGTFEEPKIPDSRAMWRLRLFILSLCPEAFKEELKKSFFRLFGVEEYYNEIISGAEYEKALQKGFFVLSDEDKKKYVESVIKYFKEKDQNKDNEKEDWHMKYGSRILSTLLNYLDNNKELKQQAQDKGFILIPDYKPTASISGPIRSGIVKPQPPITLEEFSNLPIKEIADKFQNEWSPEKLKEKNTADNFLRPINAEGAGGLLKEDIQKRFQDYINNANLFFNREKIDQHYTYSFLRGIQENIKNNRESASKINFDELINLFIKIKESAIENPFQSEKRKTDHFDMWLAGWDAVHTAMVDVIQELLDEKNGNIIINFSSYRENILIILTYLLNYSDPSPEDEDIKTAGMTTRSGNENPLVSDPFTMAINTVRGRAFQVFILFTHQDSKIFKKEDEIKISEETKQLYDNVLEQENTRALMFMFGYYLPFFYFRDKKWVCDNLSKIFPEDQGKKHLYISAWEGYLANDLYREIFSDPKFQELYNRGLKLTGEEDPQRRFFKNLNEGIGGHIALAFLFYENFGFDDNLYKKFWHDGNIKQHSAFVSFIGRAFIAGGNREFGQLEEDKKNRSIQKIKKFWEKAISEYGNNELFQEFGYWINLDNNIFDNINWLAEIISKTLEKSGGLLRWDYGLIKSISIFAENSPRHTLKIARWFLLEGGIKKGARRQITLYIDSEWFDVFKILYDKMPSETYKLIDDLVREGGKTFWKLEEIVKNKKSDQ